MLMKWSLVLKMDRVSLIGKYNFTQNDFDLLENSRGFLTYSYCLQFTKDESLAPIYVRDTFKKLCQYMGDSGLDKIEFDGTDYFDSIIGVA